MYRNTMFTVIMLVGSGALAEAQPYGPLYPPPEQGSLLGVWYAEGDPSLPCLIEAAPGRYGVSHVIFTNKRGEQSWGRVLPGGRVVADDWGGLRGRVDRDGDALFWANGTTWRR